MHTPTNTFRFVQSQGFAVVIATCSEGDSSTLWLSVAVSKLTTACDAVFPADGAQGSQDGVTFIVIKNSKYLPCPELMLHDNDMVTFGDKIT